MQDNQVRLNLYFLHVFNVEHSAEEGLVERWVSNSLLIDTKYLCLCGFTL